MWLHLLLACAVDPPGHDCDLSTPHAVLATSDFSVGALAAITEDGCVADSLSSTSGDAVVRTAGERVWALDRTGSDVLRAFTPGDYAHPELEVVAARQGNAHDLVEIDGHLFVSLYDEAEVAVLDAATGREAGWVDLSDHADADGLPEADRFVWVEGELWLALQRLDRHAGWRPAGAGRLVRIDTERWIVADAIDVGPNPRIGPSEHGVSVLSGVFFAPDGAASHVDPTERHVEVLVSESSLGLDLGTWVDDVVLGTPFEVGGDSVVGCWTGRSLAPVLEGPAWYVDAAPTPDGVWVASRPGWSGAGDAGLVRVDAACTPHDVGGPTRLPPASLTWAP